MIQNTKGWIQLSRSITELPYYFGEKFNLSQCFIDMLILAEWKDERTFYSHGHKICLKRGQIAMPIRQLAARWSMTPNTVLSRLERMEADGLINTTDTDSDTNTDTNPATQTFSDSMIQTPIATPTDTPIETPTDTLSLRIEKKEKEREKLPPPRVREDWGRRWKEVSVPFNAPPRPGRAFWYQPLGNQWLDIP